MAATALEDFVEHNLKHTCGQTGEWMGERKNERKKERSYEQTNENKNENIHKKKTCNEKHSKQTKKNETNFVARNENAKQLCLVIDRAHGKSSEL